jgi:hypothetical protein
MEALRGFERDGWLPDERQLESVLRLRMSPLVLIVAGYCMWVAERTHMPPEGTGSVETTVRGLVAGVGDACRFTGSVIDLDAAPPRNDEGVILQWPPRSGWDEAEVPLAD